MFKINKRIIWLLYGKFNYNLDEGGTISALTILKELINRGADCSAEVVFCRDYKKYYSGINSQSVKEEVKNISSDSKSFILKKIPINLHPLNHSFSSLYYNKDKRKFNKIVFEIKEIINQIKPDIVFTFQDDIFSLTAASQSNVRCFHTFSSVTFKYDRVFSIYRNDFLRALKKSDVVTRDPCLVGSIRRLWHKNSFILPPVVDRNSFIVKKRKPVYVTFISHKFHKGLVIFINVARKLPDVKFLIIDPKGIFKPTPWLKNVKVMPRQYNMKKIYSVTKILLVPALLEQSCQRVNIEAMLNGITVIASKINGIKNLHPRRGFLVSINSKDWAKNDYMVNPIYHVRSCSDYIKTIKMLIDNKYLYNRASRIAFYQSQILMQRQENLLKKFFKLMT